MMGWLFLAAVVVSQPVADMFSRPSVDAEVVSQTIYGTAVEVTETGAGWKQVRTPDGYSGWVQSRDLAERSAPEGEIRMVRVTSLFAHVYRTRNITEHKPLLTLPWETRLELIAEESERWLEVRLVDGSRAWIQRGDVSFDDAPVDTASVLHLSRRFLGLPYTWGGTSSFGYDCSGFTQMLMRQRGILMPRDADDQEQWDGLQPVAHASLEPGDLVFFGPEPQRITHTGMYIGSGEFIHATAYLKPVVQISRLDEEHWTKLYQSARRPK